MCHHSHLPQLPQCLPILITARHCHPFKPALCSLCAKATLSLWHSMFNDVFMHHMFVFFLFSSITSVSTVVLLIILLLKGSVGKEYACNAEDIGDMCSIPGLERFPGGIIGNPLKYCCLENPIDRGAWWTFSPKGCKESDTTEYAHLHTTLNTLNMQLIISVQWRTKWVVHGESLDGLKCCLK